MPRRRRYQKRVQKEPYNLIIALDFGTTTASVAWCTIPKKANEDINTQSSVQSTCINTVTNWPQEVIKDNIPTESYYRGRVKELYWGDSVKRLIDNGDITPNAEIVKHLKFWFDETERTRSNRERLARLAQSLGKTPEELATDQVRSLAKWPLSREGPISMEKSERIEIVGGVQYVLGCPAAWSYSERQKYIRVSKAAGLEDISLVSEAEAAAAAILAENNNHGLRVTIARDLGLI